MPRKTSIMSPRLTTEELSESTWKDFEDLFERNGGVWGGCWCTFYQVPRGSGWSSGPSNRERHRELLGRGKSHGVIVLSGSVPVGWCQFGPREELPRIDGRKGYQAPDGFDLWRVTCFFVDKSHRRQGVARMALDAALQAMEKSGVKLVEAYPTEVGRKRTSATLLWTGTPELFAAFGFKRVTKLGKSGWVMQKRLGHGTQGKRAPSSAVGLPLMDAPSNG